MKLVPDAVLVQRFARSDEFPYVVVLRDPRDKAKQTHRFADNHSRAEFVLGVRALARLKGMCVDEEAK